MRAPSAVVLAIMLGWGSIPLVMVALGAGAYLLKRSSRAWYSRAI